MDVCRTFVRTFVRLSLPLLATSVQHSLRRRELRGVLTLGSDWFHLASILMETVNESFTPHERALSLAVWFIAAIRISPFDMLAFSGCCSLSFWWCPCYWFSVNPLRGKSRPPLFPCISPYPWYIYINCLRFSVSVLVGFRLVWKNSKNPCRASKQAVPRVFALKFSYFVCKPMKGEFLPFLPSH